MGNRIEGFITGQFSEFVKKGGIKVSPENKKARENICNGCEYKEKKKIKTLLPKMEVCGLCDCPLATKQWMKTYFRKEDTDEPLTGKDVIMARVLGEDKLESVIIKCSHPYGNKWEEADKQY